MTTAPHPARFDCPAVDAALETAPCPLVCLTTGSAWSVAPGVREIRCVRGQVWITQPNDSHDYVLNVGDTFVVRGKGVVVQALGDATVRI
jgi:hypothetical protein